MEYASTHQQYGADTMECPLFQCTPESGWYLYGSCWWFALRSMFPRMPQATRQPYVRMRMMRLRLQNRVRVQVCLLQLASSHRRGCSSSPSVWTCFYLNIPPTKTHKPCWKMETEYVKKHATADQRPVSTHKPSPAPESRCPALWPSARAPPE